MTFVDRFQQWKEPLTLYEAVPPSRDTADRVVAGRVKRVARLLADREVDAINVPEIRVENHDTSRTVGELEKHDPREFGRRIVDRMAADVDVMVNRVVVHDPLPAQEEWFEAAYSEYDIDSVVIVGGGSSEMEYPGPSVSEGVELAHRVSDAVGSDPYLGGITIPSRRQEEFDEPDRMLAKQRAGIDFFTSQVVFDPIPVTRLLGDYDDVCRAAGVDPAPVFLSFAPITCPRDAHFLEELGVDIPADVWEWVVESEDHTARRGIQAAERVLEEVLTAVRRDSLAVPVGINVEHVMRDNIELSGQLLDQLKGLVECPK